MNEYPLLQAALAVLDLPLPPQPDLVLPDQPDLVLPPECVEAMDRATDWANYQD